MRLNLTRMNEGYLSEGHNKTLDHWFLILPKSYPQKVTNEVRRDDRLQKSQKQNFGQLEQVGEKALLSDAK